MPLRLGFFLAAAALAMAANGVAAAQSASPVQAQEQEAAAALANLVMPADMLEQEIAAGKDAFFQSLRGDPDLAAMEAEYPGLGEAMWASMEPVIREFAAKSRPDFLNRIAAFYAEKLNRREIDTLVDFYTTPTGQRIIRAMYAGVNLAPLMEAGMEGRPATGSDLAIGQGRAVSSLVEDLSEEDKLELETLAKSVSIPKMIRLGVELRELVASWINEPDPALDARLEEVLLPVMDAHMAAIEAGE